jgi:hypothetical protein
MTAIEKINQQFIQHGYVEDTKYKIPSSLLWKPDLILKKNGSTYLVLIRSSNTIPAGFLNRISHIPTNKIIPLIVFPKKLTTTDEKYITSVGIGICYFIRGTLQNFNIKKKLSENKIKQEIKKKLKQIDIFISSKQDIEEREFIRTRVNYLRDTFNYPFFCHMIEYDKFNIKSLYSHIDKVLGVCEWVVIILDDHYSSVVSYEISKSSKIKNAENIFMFVKSTSECANSWKKELNKIKKLKTIKYLPYLNKNELEVVFSKAVHVRMTAICKREKVEIFI